VLILPACDFPSDYVFYGRVVDQYGKPVAGAQVRYEGTHGYLSKGSGLGYIVTDNNGDFTISANGASLILNAVIHDDIDYSYSQITSGNSNNAGIQHPQKYQMKFQKGGTQEGYDDALKYNNRENAYIVNAYRREGYKGAFSMTTGFGLDADGAIHTLTLNKGWSHSANKMIKGELPGHLHLSCTRKQMTGAEDYGDWTFKIEPVDGGIQETNDIFLNKAPESGYQPFYSVDMKYGNPEYSPWLLNKRFYFTSNNSKEFGSLYIQFEPHRLWRDGAHSCVISVTYKMNTNGDRNLEIGKSGSSNNN